MGHQQYNVDALPFIVIIDCFNLNISPFAFRRISFIRAINSFILSLASKSRRIMSIQHTITQWTTEVQYDNIIYDCTRIHTILKTYLSVSHHTTMYLVVQGYLDPPQTTKEDLCYNHHICARCIQRWGQPCAYAH